MDKTTTGIVSYIEWNMKDQFNLYINIYTQEYHHCLCWITFKIQQYIDLTNKINNGWNVNMLLLTNMNMDN